MGSLLLLAVAIVAATGLAGLAATSPGVLSRISPFAGSLLCNLLLLVVLLQALTGIWVPWRQLLPGAAIAALGWTALQASGVYILDRQLDRANLVYGVFAIVIVLLSWLYLTAALLLFAAEINVVLARRLWAPQPAATTAHRAGQTRADCTSRDGGAPGRPVRRGQVLR